MTNTAEMENNEKLRRSSRKQVPSHLGTTRRLPEHGGGPETAGVASATKKLAGTEEEEVEKTL